MQYFKTAVLRRKAEQNGLVVYASATIIKRKEPIIRAPVGYGLSALRLCVWLSDNIDNFTYKIISMPSYAKNILSKDFSTSL